MKKMIGLLMTVLLVISMVVIAEEQNTITSSGSSQDRDVQLSECVHKLVDEEGIDGSTAKTRCVEIIEGIVPSQVTEVTVVPTQVSPTPNEEENEDEESIRDACIKKLMESEGMIRAAAKARCMPPSVALIRDDAQDRLENAIQDCMKDLVDKEGIDRAAAKARCTKKLRGIVVQPVVQEIRDDQQEKCVERLREKGIEEAIATDKCRVLPHAFAIGQYSGDDLIERCVKKYLELKPEATEDMAKAECKVPPKVIAIGQIDQEDQINYCIKKMIDVSGFSDDDATKRCKEKLEIIKSIKPQIRQIEEEVRGRIEANKEEIKTLRESLRERQREVSDLKAEVREACKEDSSDALCQEKQQEVLSRAKEQTKASIENMIAELDKIKDNALGSESLSEEDALLVAAHIDERIAILQEISGSIDAITTKEELKELTDDLREGWAKAKRTAQVEIVRLSVVKVGNVGARAKQVEEQLSKTLLELEEESIDTTEVAGMLGDFNLKLQDALLTNEQAQDAFAEAASAIGTDGFQQQMERVNELRQAAKTAMQEALELLKEIMRATKELQGQTI